MVKKHESKASVAPPSTSTPPTEVQSETPEQKAHREWEEWSSQLGQSLVDNLNRNVLSEHGKK